MRKIFRGLTIVLTLIWGWAVLSEPDRPASSNPPAKPVENRPDNTPPDGFVAVFNGKDLTDWKGLAKEPLDNPAKRAKLTADERAQAQEEADENMRKHWSVV